MLLLGLGFFGSALFGGGGLGAGVKVDEGGGLADGEAVDAVGLHLEEAGDGALLGADREDVDADAAGLGHLDEAAQVLVAGDEEDVGDGAVCGELEEVLADEGVDAFLDAGGVEGAQADLDVGVEGEALVAVGDGGVARGGVIPVGAQEIGVGAVDGGGFLAQGLDGLLLVEADAVAADGGAEEVLDGLGEKVSGVDEDSVLFALGNHGSVS